jgi:hypothetical protein
MMLAGWPATDCGAVDRRASNPKVVVIGTDTSRDHSELRPLGMGAQVSCRAGSDQEDAVLLSAEMQSAEKTLCRTLDGVEDRPADLGPPGLLVAGVVLADQVVLADGAFDSERVFGYIGR